MKDLDSFNMMTGLLFKVFMMVHLNHQFDSVFSALTMPFVS